jgi:hypothetical protein
MGRLPVAVWLGLVGGLALAVLAVWGTACEWEAEPLESEADVLATQSPVVSPTPSASPSAVPTETPAAPPTETPTALPTETAAALPTETPTALPTETSVPTPTPMAENPAGPPNDECWLTKNWPPVDYCSDHYMPGQVIVVFKEDVTRDRAATLIQSYGLSFDPSLLTDLYVWVESGPDASGRLPSLDEVVQELTGNELVHEAFPECYNEAVDTDRCISVSFIRPLTSAEVAGFLSSFEGLTLLEDTTRLVWALVCVEPGRESAWIDTFEAQNIVKYAELNGLVSTPEECAPPGVVRTTTPTPIVSPPPAVSPTP